MKILYFDIETAPLLAYIWTPWEPMVSHKQVENTDFMLTWAAKWAHKKGVMSDRLAPHEATSQNDINIVESLSELIREADVIVGHNLDKFDLPKLNGRLMIHGLEPLPPVIQVDTLKLAKRSFKLPYNRLDFLGEALGVGNKIKTDFDLWRRCYMGESVALKQMEKYNRQDVRLLEEVFEKMRPYVKNLPRLVDGTGFMCPNCGSYDLQRRGVYRTKASNFQKYQCNECKRYCRERISEKRRLDVHPI